VGVGAGVLLPLDVVDGVAAHATSRARTAAAPSVATLPRAALCFMVVEIMCPIRIALSSDKVWATTGASLAIGYEFLISSGVDENYQYIYTDSGG
jgi:hypothetical protein